MKSALTRRPVVAWALYDWANSAFATTVMAGFFPVFFKQYWSVGVEASVSTFRLGLANGVASFVIAVLAPLLGAIADRGGVRVRLLALATVLGAASTGGLYLVQEGQWQLAAVLYGIASLGFWSGVTFYDALLLDVAEDRNELDMVSSFGYALGYIGGGLLFAFNVYMTLRPGAFGLESAADAVRLSFLSVAAWWVLFSVPVVLFVREARPAQPLGIAAASRAGLRELRVTVEHIRAYKPLVWFLFAYWLYIDGVNTVIKMAVDYGLSLGFPQQSLIAALLLTQFVAFPAALAFGWLGSKIGARNGIFLALAVYAGATIGAYRMDSSFDFYALAVTIGLVQGGVQALSRSYFGSLVPAGKQGEFFGFYNMMGKFAAVLGPMLVGFTALATGSTRAGILSVVLLFVVGAALLWRARIEELRARDGARGPDQDQAAGSSR
ncbi:MAG: MFS transporter [Gammaproteobacteria bacterium SG8_30]|nr:MAG: MFS transporter [Gammaproteobacteria bacterium SG8_30]